MASLKEIRIRLSSVKSTRQITSAMKMVSAARLRKAQEAILQLRPFYFKLNDLMKRMSLVIDGDHENKFSRISEPGRVLLVVITSNRGLCGAFNANIVKQAALLIHQRYAAEYGQGKVDLLCIGKKGADLLRSKRYAISETQHQLLDKLSYEACALLANRFMSDFLSGKYKTIRLVYNQFRNAAVQDITVEQFLPVVPAAQEEDKYGTQLDYLFEPSKEDIFDEMIPYSLRMQFYRALLETQAAEHGARMTAMHKATDNATDLIRELELTYNKARQAAITKEILEIVGGAEALKG